MTERYTSGSTVERPTAKRTAPRLGEGTVRIVATSRDQHDFDTAPPPETVAERRPRRRLGRKARVGGAVCALTLVATHAMAGLFTDAETPSNLPLLEPKVELHLSAPQPLDSITEQSVILTANPSLPPGALDGAPTVSMNGPLRGDLTTAHRLTDFDANWVGDKRCTSRRVEGNYTSADLIQDRPTATHFLAAFRNQHLSVCRLMPDNIPPQPEDIPNFYIEFNP